MSTPARAIHSEPNLPQPEVLTGDRKSNFLNEFDTLVAERAHVMFEESGRLDGNDVAHWLQAEGEVAMLLPELHESAETFSANMSLVGMSSAQIEVCVTTSRGIISAASGSDTSTADSQERRTTYYLVLWTKLVEPDSCTAETREGHVVITVRKAQDD